MADQIRDPQRCEDEEPDAEGRGRDHGGGDGGVRHLRRPLLVLGGRCRRVVQRANPQDKRLDQDDRTADHRDFEERILRRDRDQFVLFDRDVAVRLADGDRVAGQRAHQHAFDDRLATDEHVNVAIPRRRGQAVRDGVQRPDDQLCRVSPVVAHYFLGAAGAFFA